MKQFIVSIYLVIIIFCGLTFNNELHKSSNNQSNIAKLLDVEKLAYSANFSDFSKLAANKVNNPNLSQIISFNYKYTLSKITSGKYQELKNNNKISRYLYIAKCQIIRLEGHNIIHPFNYFW